MQYKYHPKTKEELVEAMKKEIFEVQGTKDNPNWEADLDCIDVSQISCSPADEIQKLKTEQEPYQEKENSINIDEDDILDKRMFAIVMSMLSLKNKVLKKEYEFSDKIAKTSIPQDLIAEKEIKKSFNYIKKEMVEKEYEQNNFIKASVDALHALNFFETPVLNNEIKDKVFKTKVKKMISSDSLKDFEEIKNDDYKIENEVIIELLKEKALKIQKHIDNMIEELDKMAILVAKIKKRPPQRQNEEKTENKETAQKENINRKDKETTQKEKENINQDKEKKENIKTENKETAQKEKNKNKKIQNVVRRP